MIEKNKKIIFMIIGVILGIVLIGGLTFAWFKWNSNSSVNFNVTIDNSSGLTITFNGGSNISGAIEPTFVKEDGIVKAFSSYTNGVTVPMNIWLELNTLPDALKDSSFKWELYRDGVQLSSDNFSTNSITTRTSNNTTDYYLIKDEMVGSTTVNYVLYLWIDGNSDNNLSMASKSFDFDLYATVTS